jgi:thiol-disulfide isomerase/thioredoxin
MKKGLLIFSIILTVVLGYVGYEYYNHLQYLKSLEPGQQLWADYLAGKDVVDYHKNLYTGEILTKEEYKKFKDSLLTMSVTFKVTDSLKREMILSIINQEMGIRHDSTILSFKYTIRVGNEYLVRENSFEKIGTPVPVQSFLTITGEKIQLGGEQEKPTVINLWFVGCTGCVLEMPALNKLQEKYGDKVNFIAMTFDSEGKVKRFLTKKEFNYKHVADVEDYIKLIGTQPYPENIFINKSGFIENIEGGIPENDEKSLRYFESLIEKLL